MQIRHEQPGDERAISLLTTAAFLTAEHSDGTEAQIVERLRNARALLLSLVAEGETGIVGHIAFSPVAIGGVYQGWVGLGPISVAPASQHEGIGAALMHEGLSQIRAAGHGGCVVLGDPGYYTRFGFAVTPGITYPGVPSEYFMALGINGPLPQGEVAYHPAFTG